MRDSLTPVVNVSVVVRLKKVRHLISSNFAPWHHSYRTALQLADAMGQGNALQVTRLLNVLLEIAVHPGVIVATVTTQFRTWLWVKAATDKGLA